MSQGRSSSGPISRADWDLDPEVLLVNHGSFGACPRAVLAAQTRLRQQLEREPVRFFMYRMQPLLDASRETLARLIGADPADVAFVRNATSGVNAVLRSLAFRAGDEILLSDHSYNACRAAVEFVAGRSGAKTVVAEITIPVGSADEIVEAVLSRVTQRTRLALLDHITSPTALVLPIEQLVAELARRGVDTLVDGAHAPGMLPLEVQRIGAAYYTGNCHKWLCAPKGAGFLHVRRDRQEPIQPAVISHGYNTPRPASSRLHDLFDWTGTDDPTPWLCVGEAIRFLDAWTPGGIEGLMRRNRELALEARRTLAERLGLAPVGREAMTGTMAAVVLPERFAAGEAMRSAPRGFPIHRLQRELLDRFGIEVPVFLWSEPPKCLLRVSAHAYNEPSDYRRLATALADVV